MKRAIIIMLVMVQAAALQATAGDKSGKDISVSDLRFEIREDGVRIEFEITAGRKAAPRGRSLIITPVIGNDDREMELPFVVVEGRASKAVAERHAMAAGSKAWDGAKLKNGESTVYNALFPYEEWMEGASVRLDGASVGCCASRVVELGAVALEVLVTKGFDVVEVRVERPAVERLSTAEKLAADFPFIIPVTPDVVRISSLTASELDEKVHPELIKMLTDTRDNTLTIYFHQNESRIDYSYADNNASLVKLISAVRAIEESGDSRIARVMIAGFASPEGTSEINDRLGRDRALAVKAFLNDKSPVYGDMVTIYNGREDWSGLRLLVEASDMPYRQEVLGIIDNVPVWDSKKQTGRRVQLMNLRGGEPYRYMFREFFPMLRNAAYIKIYYENIAPLQ